MGCKFTKYSLLLWTVLCAVQLGAQVAEVEYGKNRIQYHDDFDQWLLYESENFITYWYGKARNHGVSTVKLAEQDHDEILDIIEHRINDKIEIIVYSDVSDLKQSNIGSEEVFYTSGGRTKIEGNKIFVYFEGDHEDLRVQIRKGIATVFLNNMFFGSNLQEVVQNSVSGSVPMWFRDGLADYVGSFWNPKDDAALRNLFLTERRTNFKRMSGFYPTIVGHSLWYYIGLTYGRSEISNLLYLTRINRSIDDAFLYVFGIPFADITEQWELYFKERYEAESEVFSTIDQERLNFKRRKRVPITMLRYSPDGSALAIVDNQIGRTRIVLKDLRTGESQRIFRHGFRNNVQATDYTYPMISWLPDGSALYILYEYRDKLTLQLINFSTGEVLEQVLPERYERVYGMDCLSDRELVFSALSGGMVDLFYYTTHNRQTNQLTQDIYDDLDIRRATIDGVKGIIFSSNRPDVVHQSTNLDTVLPFLNFKLFHLAFEDESRPQLYQVTDNETVDYRQPLSLSDNALVFLSDENGIVNRKELKVERETTPMTTVNYTDGRSVTMEPAAATAIPDSLVESREATSEVSYLSSSTFQSNHLRNIEAYDVSSTLGVVAEVFQIKDDYHLYQSSLGASFESAGSSFHNRMLETRQPSRPDAAPSAPVPAQPREEIIRSGDSDGKQYLFQSRFEDMVEDEAEEILEEATSQQVASTAVAQLDSRISRDSQPINRLRIVPYQLKFKMHSLSTTMDNSLLFGGLDSYAAFKEEYEPVPLGILIKANFKDLFEDYVFEGGVRIPTSFNGTEFFLVFDDKKNRLDKRYAVYRKSLNENILLGGSDPSRSRTTILLGQFGVKYPLDIYQSLRATATLRQDKITFLASDRGSLANPDLEDQRFGVRLEYVFDNSLDIDLNIRSGARVKVFTEVVKKFAFSIDPLSLELAKGFMTVVGTDSRYYLNFGKHSVLASRFAAATSFGSERILHFLGGQDNWLIPKFNQEIPQPQGNFAYQTIAPNLRGFDYNIRNGSTYALINTEVRIPIMKYLFRRPIKISFFRHLQVVGFADVGAAWEGISPFDEDNPINIVHVSNPPTVRVKVNYYRDPVVVGYGVGLRTMLFGYFLRLDYGWGIETRVVQKPKLHFALGVDF